MEAMHQRNSIHKLAGDMQIDDAYQGGEKPGRVGRGAENKAPFVVAVETRDGRPIYVHLRPVAASTAEAIKDFAKRNIAAGARVISDGLGCFNGVAEAGLEHVRRVTGGGRPNDSALKWVSTCLGNIKSALTGTLRRDGEPQGTGSKLNAYYPVKGGKIACRFICVAPAARTIASYRYRVVLSWLQ